MVKMVPIDPKWHTGKALRQGAAYGFVASQALAPLTAAEFPAAASSMPIAFLQNTPGHYIAVAVMSPVQGRNFFVSPTGQWLGNYIPAALRSYPFRLGTAEGSSTVRLCIDEDAGAVVDAVGGFVIVMPAGTGGGRQALSAKCQSPPPLLSQVPAPLWKTASSCATPGGGVTVMRQRLLLTCAMAWVGTTCAQPA